MLLINNTNINPYFNLAMEEYFLKNAKEDIFLLWQNENAIIVGKNQNTLSEINYDYVKNNNIRIDVTLEDLNQEEKITFLSWCNANFDAELHLEVESNPSPRGYFKKSIW